MATREEVVARRVFDLLSDVRLDTYMIGFYLAHSPDPNIYRVLAEVIDSTLVAQEEREDRIKKLILENDYDMG